MTLRSAAVRVLADVAVFLLGYVLAGSLLATGGRAVALVPPSLLLNGTANARVVVAAALLTGSLCVVLGRLAWGAARRHVGAPAGGA